MVKRVKSSGHKNGKSNGHSNQIGRPSKYDPDYPRQAKLVCRLGATDAELADLFQVTISTLRLWIIQYPEFSDAVKIPKGIPDDGMERSLYMKGRGYFIDTEKIFCHDGEVIRVPTREWIQPDTAAAFIWLKNRRPDKWRDKHEIDVSGKMEHRFTLEIFEHQDGSGGKLIEHQPKKQIERVR